MISAGKSINSLMKQGPQSYNLSHEISDRGFYAIPITEFYFLLIIYEKVNNPSQMKMRLRQLGCEVEAMLSQNCSFGGAKMTPGGKKDALLFANITDAEIDQLFNL